MRRMFYGGLVVAFGLLVWAIPAPAHHAFAAEFDANKCTDLSGTFTSYEWQNPHGSVIPIPIRDILKAGGEDEQEIRAVMRELHAATQSAFPGS